MECFRIWYVFMLKSLWCYRYKLRDTHTHTDSYMCTQHFISPRAYNFCSRPRACCLSLSRLTVYSSVLTLTIAVSGFMSLWCTDVKYPGQVGGLVSGVHHNLLAPQPATNPEDYPLSAARDCIFNTYPATIHILFTSLSFCTNKCSNPKTVISCYTPTLYRGNLINCTVESYLNCDQCNDDIWT